MKDFNIPFVPSVNQLVEKTAPYHQKLSKREIECVYYLTRGMTAKEIGKKISLSNRTVESYLENAKSKLGCNRRSELVDRVMELGLLKGFE